MLWFMLKIWVYGDWHMVIFSQLGDHGSKPHDPWTFWIIWSSFLNFLNLDQKKKGEFLIRIKKKRVHFWSGSKKKGWIFDPDQKKRVFFWSGSKIFSSFFDPDQKISKKVNLQNWSQFEFLPNRTWVMTEFRFFSILGCNLTKKYHQYRKKWTSKTGVNSTFYLIERELWPNFVFFDFGL